MSKAAPLVPNGTAYVIDTLIASILLIHRDLSVEDCSDPKQYQYGINATTRFSQGILRNNTVAKMGKDGRILIPKLPMALLRSEKPDPAGYVIEVILEPA